MSPADTGDGRPGNPPLARTADDCRSGRRSRRPHLPCRRHSRRDNRYSLCVMWTGSHPTSSSAPRNRSGRALFLVGVVTVACSSSSSPPHDAAAFDIVFVDPRTAICGDAAVSRPPYAVIQQIIDSNCLSCHFAGNDLVLTHDVSWTNLVGRAAPESCGGVLVVPGDPGASYLYQ